MHVRVAVVGNGIGQVQWLNYLGEVQMKMEQGEGFEPTICMVCVGWCSHMPPGS